MEFYETALAMRRTAPGGADPSRFGYLPGMQHEGLRREWMNGTADVPGEGIKVHGEEEDVVGVFLTCVSCGKVERIHVFRDRGLPRKVYWECLDCQKNGNRCASILKPVAQGRSRPCE